MLKQILFFLKCTVFITLFSASKRGEAQGWLAYGDLRGYLEPCGCDPATDLGGLRRIAAVLSRERLAHPEFVVLGLGNSLPVFSSDELKVPFLMEAEELLQVTAVLFNRSEARHLQQLKVQKPKIPYVLSNSGKTLEGLSFIHPLKKTQHFIILGFTFDPREKAFFRPLSQSLIQSWNKLLKSADPKHETKWLLLFSGSDRDLKILLEAKIFDSIISSNTASFDDHPDETEKRDENRLIRNQKFQVLMVPLGGQGILRGEDARFAVAKPLDQILSNSLITKPTLTDPLSVHGKAEIVTWLDRSVQEGDFFFDFFRRYNLKASEKFTIRANQRIEALKTSAYAGAEACKTCHEKSYALWKESKHAHAMKTLQDKEKDKDLECVVCHVLGAEEKGGFVNMEHSPEFANVQCETCHGPRKEHVFNPALKPKDFPGASTVCVNCHNSKHSPRFQHEVYWKKIEHGHDFKSGN